MRAWEKSEVTVLCLILGALLVGLALVGHLQGRAQRRHLVSAVTEQVDAHSASIAILLSEAGSSSNSQIEDAVYEELQGAPSTSLITREMVSVRQSPSNVFECVIDTTSLGLQARRISAKSRMK
jgi:hypothetical protein